MHIEQISGIQLFNIEKIIFRGVFSRRRDLNAVRFSVGRVEKHVLKFLSPFEFRIVSCNDSTLVLPCAASVAVKGLKRVIDDNQSGVHNHNVNGYTMGLLLEMKVSDVEYESEEIESRDVSIYLFCLNKVSKIKASESLRDAYHVSLSKMPLCCPCPYKPPFL